MEIRSYRGCHYEHPQQSAQTRTQGRLVLSFPLFRPFKVCIVSWIGVAHGHQAVSGDVAQLGEHLLCTQGVTGSSPVISTRTLSTE